MKKKSKNKISSLKKIKMTLLPMVRVDSKNYNLSGTKSNSKMLLTIKKQSLIKNNKEIKNRNSKFLMCNMWIMYTQAIVKISQ